MIASIFLAVALVAASRQGPDCVGGFELVKILRSELLPRWFDITPSEARGVTPFELNVVAGSDGTLWEGTSGICDARFSFRANAAGLQLHRVSFYVRAPKSALVTLVRALLSAVDFAVSDVDVNELSAGDVLDFSRRNPADTKQPGIWTVATVKLSVDGVWQLEFQLIQSAEPAKLEDSAPS